MRRPAIQFGLAQDARGRFRNARFASFMAASNRQGRGSDLQDMILLSRRYFRRVLFVLVVLGAAWVALESAHALSAF